jgi:Zn-dependent protease with chaperone function
LSEPAATRSRAAFLLRVFPALLSLAVIATLLLPAYVEHEPVETNETVGFKLLLLSALSAAGIACAGWRVYSSWRATRRLLRDWTRNAWPVELDGCDLPAYVLRHRFPVVAVVGARRPRLFVAERLFDELTAAELSAAVAHELGHVSARDNFKRALMRVCRDALLFNPCGHALDRQWAEASESAADEYAAGSGGRVAIDLASALVKIARLVPEGARPAVPAGSYLLGDGGLDGRVRRLLKLAERPSPPEGRGLLLRRLALAAPLLVLALLITVVVRTHDVHSSTHDLIEVAVNILK